jgi:fatty-acyl-CoA synthase
VLLFSCKVLLASAIVGHSFTVKSRKGDILRTGDLMDEKVRARQAAFVLREKTLGQVLDDTVARTPDTDALVCYGTDFRLTWREFGDLVAKLAKGLLALGLQKGEKLAIWAPNVPYWIPLQFATAQIGVVLLTVNTNYRDHELRYLLEQSECENLCMADGVHDVDFFKILNCIAPERLDSSPESLSVPALPHLRRIITLGNNEAEGCFGIQQVLALAEQVSDADYAARQAELDPWDVINMQYTSGTTGFPKGVMLTHVGVGLNGYWIGKHQGFSPADRVCLPIPMFHCFGCVLGVSACVNHGATMITLENFNSLDVLKIIQSERATALYGVPTMFLAVLEHRSFQSYDVSSLRTGIMAGAVCPEPLMRRVMNELHMPEITICYGLTEGSPVMTQTDAHDPIDMRCKTVGCAMPGIEVRIADPETCAELPRGSNGEVLCRGYNVMRGYYNMPEATAETVTPEGWLHSGDLGVMDEQGYVTITGRIKDMILRGGENVYPREVEEYLMSMPAVLDVQVVAVPSLKYGEEVGAFIIPREGASISPEAVREYCRGTIAWYKIPRYVHCLEAFPMTGSRKIQKFKLRELAASLWPEAMQERSERKKKHTHTK